MPIWIVHGSWSFNSEIFQCVAYGFFRPFNCLYRQKVWKMQIIVQPGHTTKCNWFGEVFTNIWTHAIQVCTLFFSYRQINLIPTGYSKLFVNTSFPLKYVSVTDILWELCQSVYFEEIFLIFCVGMYHQDSGNLFHPVPGHKNNGICFYKFVKIEDAQWRIKSEQFGQNNRKYRM